MATYDTILQEYFLTTQLAKCLCVCVAKCMRLNIQATKVRIEKVKYKMNIAIEILQTQKKEITHYAIAKISNVSFNTVKKI